MCCDNKHDQLHRLFLYLTIVLGVNPSFLYMGTQWWSYTNLLLIRDKNGSN